MPAYHFPVPFVNFCDIDHLLLAPLLFLGWTLTFESHLQISKEMPRRNWQNIHQMCVLIFRLK